MKVHVADRFFCDLCGAEMERLSTYKKDFIMAKDFNGWYATDKDMIEFRDLCVPCKTKIAKLLTEIRETKGKECAVSPEEEKMAFGQKVKDKMLGKVYSMIGDLSHESDEIKKFGCHDVYRPFHIIGAIDALENLGMALKGISLKKIADKCYKNPLNAFDGDNVDDDERDPDDDLYDTDSALYDTDDDDDEED